MKDFVSTIVDRPQ